MQLPPAGNWIDPPVANRSRLFPSDEKHSWSRIFPAGSRAAPVPLPGGERYLATTVTAIPLDSGLYSTLNWWKMFGRSLITALLILVCLAGHALTAAGSKVFVTTNYIESLHY
jgi:hypothetical protein